MSQPTNPIVPAPEFLTLTDGYCVGTLSVAEGAQLQAMLSGNRQAQRNFLAYLGIHARICWDTSVHSTASDSPPGRTVPALQSSKETLPQVARHKQKVLGSRLSHVSPRQLFAVAACCVVGICFFWFRADNRPVDDRTAAKLTPPVSADAARIAEVTRAAGRWNENAAPIQAGEPVSAGMLNLTQGFVELTFLSGAVVLLEAPARLEIVDAAQSRLHFGRAVARVLNHSGKGFTILTQAARLVDLGTEFGVAVDSIGNTQMQVFDGVVQAEVCDASGDQIHIERLVAGEACAIDAALRQVSRDVPFQPERFVRTFPMPNERQGPENAYNESRIDTIHVARVLQPIKINADLADWDLSRGFQSACIEPYSENFRVRGLMAYDDQNLYIAAHIHDPAPMSNRVDPQSDASFFWAGGSVLVRLAANKTFAWPLAVSGWPPDATAKLEPAIDDQIVHLGMWYYQPEGSPQFRIDHGIACLNKELPPAGWKGAFRKDADGFGYSMEYSIPWSVLKVPPPQPGDTWPATWNVHWSDQKGRTCMGQLVEITNLSDKPYLFLRGASWGKAVFE